MATATKTTTKPTTKKPAVPLTPAQVELVKQLVDQRHLELQAWVDAQISAAVTPLEESTVKYGEKVALRANRGKLVAAKEGGPAEEDQAFEFVTRQDPGPWESYTVERGQG